MALLASYAGGDRGRPTLTGLSVEYIERLRERFAERYTPEPNSGCWLWLGAVTERGYGLMLVGKRTLRAHRVSYALVHGDDDHELFVCHRCDVPSCVNPAHLFVGTPKDNTQDMLRKGREARGLRNGAHTHPETVRRGEAKNFAKLTESQVLEIRAAFARGGGQSEIARAFGVKSNTVHQIVRRITWRHLPPSEAA